MVIESILAIMLTVAFSLAGAAVGLSLLFELYKEWVEWRDTRRRRVDSMGDSDRRRMGK